MNEHQVEAAVSDAVAQVGDSVDELTGKTGKTMQEKIDQAKPALRDLQESAGAALDKAGDLAQKASIAGAQAVDAVQGVARDVANHASETATAACTRPTFPGQKGTIETTFIISRTSPAATSGS